MDELTLIRASMEDAERIWQMQKCAFAALLQKYGDRDTSPAAEPLHKVRRRLMQPETYYYLICMEKTVVGAIRVVHPKEDNACKRISPLFILPEYQGKSLATKAVRLAEGIHGQHHWELDTILEEPGNCHFYEKLGYKKTGEYRRVNDRMTLVFYRKD